MGEAEDKLEIPYRPGLEKVAAPLWEVAIRYAVTNTTAQTNNSRSRNSPSKNGAVDGVGRRLL